MFERLGNCVVCGKKTQKFCDGCKSYVCETHLRKPFADIEIILCENCWERKNEILKEIKKHEKTDLSDIFPDYP